MSISVVGWYVCAALLVASCAATVVLRAPRLTLLGGAATVVSLSLLLIVSGATILALALLVVGSGTLGLLTVAGRRGGFGEELEIVAWGRWPLGVAVGLAAGLVVDVTAVVSDGGWHRGAPGANLATLLHYRAPIVLGVLAVLAATALACALIIGLTSPDEVVARKARAARTEREERMRRRRDDRAAARKKRSGARGSA